MVFENTIEKFKRVMEKPGIIRVISHLDTDGLTSAALMSSFLKDNDQEFWLSIVKQLEDSYLEEVMQNAKKHNFKAIVFLDLGLSKLVKIKTLMKDIPVFVIDHHEPDANLDEKTENLHLVYLDEKMCAAGLTYLFLKEFDSKNKKLAQLAVIGTIGDMLDKSLSRSNSLIFKHAQESGMQIKKGLTVFSSMRPIHKSLEFSSNIFIPGITGNVNGSLAMLRGLGIEIKSNNGYRTILDLNKDEMSRLITGVLLRRVNHGHNQEVIDNVYLVKINNKIYDTRELSTMLNASGRLGHSSTGISLLLGSKKAHEEMESVYTNYKHKLIRALNWANSTKKIEKEGYIILNAKDQIIDTIIGTVVTIMSNSFLYPINTVVIGMAYRGENYIKISARVVKDHGKEADINLTEILGNVVKKIGGEVGGHKNAAGALIERKDEIKFLDILEEELSLNSMKIKI